MIVSSASRRARKVVAQVDLLERVRQEIVAATARLLQPTGVLVPVRVFNDRKKRGRSRDWFSKPQPFL